MAKPQNADEYINTFPQATQKLLQDVREIVKKAVPGAAEVISYSMPAFKFNGMMLVWFAGYAHHIGFYPGSHGIAAFQNEIADYKNAKGSVQFPLDKPMPAELITRMVQFKIEKILQKAELKKKPKG